MALITPSWGAFLTRCTWQHEVIIERSLGALWGDYVRMLSLRCSPQPRIQCKPFVLLNLVRNKACHATAKATPSCPLQGQQC